MYDVTSELCVSFLMDWDGSIDDPECASDWVNLDMSPLMSNYPENINSGRIQRERMESAIYIASMWCTNVDIRYDPIDNNEEALADIDYILTEMNNTVKQLSTNGELIDYDEFVRLIHKARYLCKSMIGDRAVMPLFWVDSNILTLGSL